MKWLRFIALLIFVFITAYCVPYTVRNPIFSNIIITIIFVVITIWIAWGFVKKPKQNIQQQS